MRLQPRLLTALAVLALLHTPVRAEDTPSNMGPADSGSTRPAADPLGPARNAIAAQQWPRALDLLKAQLPQLNRNADLHNLLGFAYRKQARPDLPKAFEHYKLALSIDPRHRGAHEYIGEAYLMNKQPAKAREHLDTLKTLCGGTACEEYQDLAKALAAYRD
jgi:tetratricopeptide (TPR) repeat protein